MNKVEQILNEIKHLNPEDIKRVSNALLHLLGKTFGVYGTSISAIEKCRKCNANQIVKFGKDKNGKQRYKCKSCGSTFTETSYSVLSKTKHSFAVWEEYIHLLLIGASLTVCAHQCRISVRTAFIWRHKILQVLEKDQDNRILAGIVEADEMFIPVSYKGNHNKSKHFVMPRPAFKRGSDNRSNKIPKACVMCAVERNGQSYGEVIGQGQPTVNMIFHAFENRIVGDSIVISDYASSIKRYFSGKANIELVQMRSTADGSRHSKIPEVRGVYHIQTVNNFHTRFHRFLRKYNGVSTKYLDHYLSLFVWVENNKRVAQRLEDVLKTCLVKEKTYTSSSYLFAHPPVPHVA